MEEKLMEELRGECGETEVKLRSRDVFRGFSVFFFWV
jgi:hypothetical protein